MPDENGKAQNYRQYFGRPWQTFGRRMLYRHIGIDELTGSGESASSGTGLFPYTFPIMMLGSE